MKLLEINNIFQMDTGAAMPSVISNDSELLVLFFDNSDSKDNCIVLRFAQFLSFKFGLPNDEALNLHKYFHLGLKPYSFFELQDSDWFNEINIFNNWDVNRWEDYKHYIITFHDNTFECIAKNFEFKKESPLFIKNINKITNQDFVK